MGIRVAGVGGYVPSKTMTNYELAMMVDTSDEWITKKTGIRERRIAAPAGAPARPVFAHPGPRVAWPPPPARRA